MSVLEDTKKKVLHAMEKVRCRPEAKSPKGRQLLAEFSKKAEAIDVAIGNVFTSMDELAAKAEAEAVEEIIILEQIWSGTTVQLGDATLNVRTSIHKPRLARRKRTRVMLMPLGEGNMPED